MAPSLRFRLKDPRLSPAQREPEKKDEPYHGAKTANQENRQLIPNDSTTGTNSTLLNEDHSGLPRVTYTNNPV